MEIYRTKLLIKTFFCDRCPNERVYFCILFEFQIRGKHCYCLIRIALLGSNFVARPNSFKLTWLEDLTRLTPYGDVIPQNLIFWAFPI